MRLVHGWFHVGAGAPGQDDERKNKQVMDHSTVHVDVSSKREIEVSSAGRRKVGGTAYTQWVNATTSVHEPREDRNKDEMSRV